MSLITDSEREHFKRCIVEADLFVDDKSELGLFPLFRVDDAALMIGSLAVISARCACSHDSSVRSARDRFYARVAAAG